MRKSSMSPYVLTHTSRRLRLSSLCAYYFFARKSFSEPGWIRQSTRHLEWQKTVNWSTWVPIAFWNFLTYAMTPSNTFLRLSSLCAYYFFARKSFSEPGWIRQSTRHLEWQKTVNWSTWVPIAFWNFLTWCNDTCKYFSPFKYWGLPHSSSLF